MRKKFIAGAAILALLVNAPQVKADDIVVFGGEFEDNVPAPKKVEKPAPIKELPPEPPAPIEEPVPVEDTPVPPPPEVIKPQPPTQPLEQPDEPNQEPAQVAEPVEPQDVSIAPPEEDDDIGDTLTFNDLNKKPEQKPIEQPTPPPPPAVEEPKPAPITQEPPPIEQPQVEPIINEPTPKPITHEPTTTEPVQEFERPFEQPSKTSGEDVVVVLPPTPPQPEFTPPTPQPVEQIEPLNEQPVREQPARQSTPRTTRPQKNLKTLQPRFIKLAVDETYTYYLDKNSVQWIKMPYSTSEYIADVWIRMIERNPAPLDDDMASYGADNYNAEISLAREQGYQYSADDVHVLRSQAYVLEHYYLRPKTRQIQFLCELEVFGRPQNTVSERAYDYRNWENLVPGSVESVIYASTIKVIGEWKSTERGHMTFSDMLDEYLRISL